MPPDAARAGGSQRGFTLWELLVVVAIVAITISMVQFSVGLGDQTRDLKRVGKDLGKLFHLLSQEAVFESRNYAISVQEKGFIVLEYEDGGWAQVEDSFFKRIKLTESQVSELIMEDKVINISSQDEPQPHILILASGEMTPFEWRIRDKLSQSGILLQGNILGSVLMIGPEPLG
ncbi:MAG: prepilin-type N-terminal cleavage/methylation domain-containing protein [Gammaproteobacteria bacterium]|nr:prepilin-type N-terminal cleavage/methylation domain-containing protein [Gammaproteobacteria bacterium]